jgi:hypothetical protein
MPDKKGSKVSRFRGSKVPGSKVPVFQGSRVAARPGRVGEAFDFLYRSDYTPKREFTD